MSHLAGVVLFRGIADKVLREIAAVAELEVAEKGAQIIREGDVGDAFYLVRTGHAKVTRSAGDREDILALAHVLEPLQLAWVVEHEVLKITTQTKADEILTPRVYDVRDLLPEEGEPQWSPPSAPPENPGPAGFGSGTLGVGGPQAAPIEILRQGFGSGPVTGHGFTKSFVRPAMQLVNTITQTIEPESLRALLYYLIDSVLDHNPITPAAPVLSAIG